MIRWYRHTLKNPTRYFILFYTMLIWRVLAVYYGITALSLIVVCLLTVLCYIVYSVFCNLSAGRRILLSLGILLICLPVLTLLRTHITYALYRVEGVVWAADPSPFIALYPVLLLFLLMLKDRYFHPLGMVVSLPFVLFSWATLIQDQLKVWIILYLFLSLIEASVWVYARTRENTRTLGLRMTPHKRMVLAAALVFVCIVPVLFFPLSALGTRSLRDILDPSGASSLHIDEFDLYTIGYGDKTALGGPIEPDDTLLMTAEAGSPLYLRGSVKDRYTGHAWQTTRGEYDMQDEYAVHEIDKDSQTYIDAGVSRIRIYPAVDDINALFTSPARHLYLRRCQCLVRPILCLLPYRPPPQGRALYGSVQGYSR